MRRSGSTAAGELFELGGGAALRVAPELSDPVGPLEVGQHQTWRSSARGAGPRARAHAG
jgi:hypothetical protein